jgi:DNA-directed RNA polymerase specialized sigma24 family protein
MSEPAAEQPPPLDAATVVALQELAQRRGEFVGFAARRLGAEHEARDAVQTAYLRAIERLPSLREVERVVPWFYRILRNVVADAQGARGKEQTGGLPRRTRTGRR